MFDKKIVTITSFFVSEAHATPNLHTTLRICGLKGGKADGQKAKKSCQEKISQEKKALAPSAVNDREKSFAVITPNFSPGGESVFLPVFFFARKQGVDLVRK
jgi:hypothetical protein